MMRQYYIQTDMHQFLLSDECITIGYLCMSLCQYGGHLSPSHSHPIPKRSLQEGRCERFVVSAHSNSQAPVCSAAPGGHGELEVARDVVEVAVAVHHEDGEVGGVGMALGRGWEVTFSARVGGSRTLLYVKHRDFDQM